MYGPLLAAGLKYWFQDEAQLLGPQRHHPGDAFMAHCGLPTLPGAPPFGGHIMSHDFVEAALLRRGGSSVWLLPELRGSYEQLPPTLIEFAAATDVGVRGICNICGCSPSRACDRRAGRIC